MKILKTKMLIDFNRLPRDRRKNFVKREMRQLKKPKQSGSGGNYWVQSWSAVRKSYYESDSTFIEEKIEDITVNKYPNAKTKPVKDRYQRNLDILYCYLEEDFEELKPKSEMIFLKRPTKPKIKIRNLELSIPLDFVFTFEDEGIMKVGAITFVSKLKGYKPIELGILSEAVYTFLQKKYSKNFVIATEYISIVDIESQTSVNYQMIEENELDKLLEYTVDEFSKFI